MFNRSAAAALRWCHAKWRVMQVELHGQYSNTQLQRFEQYQAATSLWRVAMVCLLTPLPTVAVAIAFGMLRLEPIENGAFHSTNVWLRQWLTAALTSLCTLQQLHQHLSEFKIDRVDCVLIPLLSATCYIASTLPLSSVVGYPLPFTMICGGISWYTAFIVTFVIRKRRVFQESPNLFSKMNRYMFVSSCQMTMTLIYPIYVHLYQQLASARQTAFVLILPLVKLLMKNWISHSLPDSDDAKPEAIVFNVEIFHSLFVSLCMGNTTSPRTIVALMALDLLEVWIALHDIQDLLTVLQPVASKLQVSKSMRLDRYPSIAILANGLIGGPSQSVLVPSPTPSSKVASWWKRQTENLVAFDLKYVHASAKLLKNRRVAPAPHLVLDATMSRPAEALHGSPRATLQHELLSSAHACLTSSECAFLVTQTEKLLFVTEFVVLVEYTEVILPTIYNTVVWAFYHLPNREFYTFLDGICSRDALFKILSNVQLYAVLELLSLFVIAFVLWRKIGLSVVHQLAFVLEDRAANIQAKLLTWVPYILQSSLVQLGADYSFRFPWLHQLPGAEPFAFTTPCENATATWARDT